MTVQCIGFAQYVSAMECHRLGDNALITKGFTVECLGTHGEPTNRLRVRSFTSYPILQ